MFASWLYKDHADYENAYEGFVDYYQDQCIRALSHRFPGISKSVARCICYAFMDEESYAIDIFEKSFLEKKHAVCLLEWDEHVKDEMIKEFEQNGE